MEDSPTLEQLMEEYEHVIVMHSLTACRSEVLSRTPLGLRSDKCLILAFNNSMGPSGWDTEYLVWKIREECGLSAEQMDWRGREPGILVAPDRFLDALPAITRNMPLIMALIARQASLADTRIEPLELWSPKHNKLMPLDKRGRYAYLTKEI